MIILNIVQLCLFLPLFPLAPITSQTVNLIYEQTAAKPMTYRFSLTCAFFPEIRMLIE